MLILFCSPPPPAEDVDVPKPKAPVVRQVNGASPEMVPSYRLIKSIIEKKNKLQPGLWNKENGDKLKETVTEVSINLISIPKSNN